MTRRKDTTSLTLSVHRFVLSCVGIWPVKKKNLFMDLRWLIAVVLEAGAPGRPFTVIFQVTPMCVYFTEIYLHCNGAKESFDKITPCAAAALALTRLITPRIHRRELVEIVGSMMDDWATQRDERVRWVMRKYSTLTTRVTTFTFFLVSIIVGVYIFLAISAVNAKTGQVDNEVENASRTAEEVLSCVFQGEKSQQAFMVVQALQMFVTGILTFGTTSFFFGLAMHLCSQFDALSIKLSDFRVEEAHQAIAEAVERHCHLIRMANSMEESFNANILIYLFVTSTLMCIDGFMLIVSLKINDVPMIIHNASVLSLMMIQLSFYTFAGDCLEMRSAALSYATYNCDWPELRANAARDIRFMLMRASIPHQLTAGKFVAMNMLTFKDILKSTASYLSVLRVMLDE